MDRKVPFEIKEMSAQKNGFRLTFTQPVDVASVTNPKNFKMTSYTYPYHSNYGGEPVDIKTHRQGRQKRTLICGKCSSSLTKCAQVTYMNCNSLASEIARAKRYYILPLTTHSTVYLNKMRPFVLYVFVKKGSSRAGSHDLH